MLETNKESLITAQRMFILLLLIACISVFLFSKWDTVYPIFPKNTLNNSGAFAKEEDKVSIFADKLKPVYAKPKAIYLPSIFVTLPIDEVGVLTDGSLETPKEWKTAGWYNRGAKPDQNGNLIINGHYDDNLGRPAAFWLLKNVKVGDKVVLRDEFGREYSYKITDTFYVSIDDSDRLKVFESDENKAEITLVTCGGVWLPGVANYNKRLVVKGELIV